jgi:hypothetical protein
MFESVHLCIGKITLNLQAYWVQPSESYCFSLQAETDPIPEIVFYLLFLKLFLLIFKTPYNGQSPNIYSIMKTNKIHGITHM